MPVSCVPGAPRAAAVFTSSSGSSPCSSKQGHVGAYQREPATPQLLQDRPGARHCSLGFQGLLSPELKDTA